MRKALLTFAADVFWWSAQVVLDVSVACLTFALVTLPRWRWEWQQIRAQRAALPASRVRQFRKVSSD